MIKERWRYLAREDDDLRDLYEYVDEEDEEEEEEGEEDEEGPEEDKEWEWTLTNKGAVMCMAGLVIGVTIIAFLSFSGIVFLFLIIPTILLMVIGYGLIVKDHLEHRKNRDKGMKGRKKRVKVPMKRRSRR